MSVERQEFKPKSTKATTQVDTTSHPYNDSFRIPKDQAPALRAIQAELKTHQQNQKEFEEFQATQNAIAAVESYERKHQETKGDSKSTQDDTHVDKLQFELKAPRIEVHGNQITYHMETESYLITAIAQCGDDNESHDLPVSIQFTHKASGEKSDSIFSLQSQKFNKSRRDGTFSEIHPLWNDRILICRLDQKEIQISYYNIGSREISEFIIYKLKCRSQFDEIISCEQLNLQSWSDGEKKYLAFTVYLRSQSRYGSEVGFPLPYSLLGVVDFTDYSSNQKVSKKYRLIDNIVSTGYFWNPGLSIRFDFLDKGKLSLIKKTTFDTYIVSYYIASYYIDFNKGLVEFENNPLYSYDIQFPNEVVRKKVLKSGLGNFECLPHLIDWYKVQYLPNLLIFYHGPTRLIGTVDIFTGKKIEICSHNGVISDLFIGATGYIHLMTTDGVFYKNRTLSDEYEKWWSNSVNRYYTGLVISPNIWNIIIEYTGEKYSFNQPLAYAHEQCRFSFAKIGNLPHHIPYHWRQEIYNYQAALKAPEKERALKFFIEQLDITDNCLKEGYLAVENTRMAFPGVAQKGMFGKTARLEKLFKQIENESKASLAPKKQ